MFHTFKDIQAVVEQIVEGKITAEEVARRGAEEERRRNEEKEVTTR